MEITKGDRDWQQEHIHRMPDVVAHQLDELSNKHPAEERGETKRLRVTIPGLSGFQVEEKKEAISEQSPM